MALGERINVLEWLRTGLWVTQETCIICHKWPCHERDLTRTFVGGQFSKAHELLANEDVGFFALLSNGHWPLYLSSRLALIVSTRRQDYTYAPVIRSQNRCTNTSTGKICSRQVSLCRCNSHNTTGPTAASLHLANEIVQSRGHCLQGQCRKRRENLAHSRNSRLTHSIDSYDYRFFVLILWVLE